MTCGPWVWEITLPQREPSTFTFLDDDGQPEDLSESSFAIAITWTGGRLDFTSDPGGGLTVEGSSVTLRAFTEAELAALPVLLRDGENAVLTLAETTPDGVAPPVNGAVQITDPAGGI